MTEGIPVGDIAIKRNAISNGLSENEVWRRSTFGVKECVLEAVSTVFAATTTGQLKTVITSALGRYNRDRVNPNAKFIMNAKEHTTGQIPSLLTDIHREKEIGKGRELVAGLRYIEEHGTIPPREDAETSQAQLKVPFVTVQREAATQLAQLQFVTQGLMRTKKERSLEQELKAVTEFCSDAADVLNPRERQRKPHLQVDRTEKGSPETGISSPGAIALRTELTVGVDATLDEIDAALAGLGNPGETTPTSDN